MSPDISFLIPVHNAAATLDGCLAALGRQELDGTVEFVFVDDGSTDGSAERLAQARRADPTRVRVLTRPNGGEAAALNTGWPETRGRWVAIIEADVEPAPDWTRRCLAALAESESAIAAGGHLVTPEDDPWIARLAGYEVEAKLLSRGAEVEHLTSANVLYRREAFDIAGPFDESLVNASLDAVFNQSLRAAGRTLLYVREARALHHYKTSLAGFLRRQIAYARYRAWSSSVELYPADRSLAVEVAAAALAVGLVGAGALTLALARPAPDPASLDSAARALALGGVVSALVALGMSTTRAWRFRALRPDPALWLYPPVSLLRALVAAPAAGVGWLDHRLRSSRRPGPPRRSPAPPPADGAA